MSYLFVSGIPPDHHLTIQQMLECMSEETCKKTKLFGRLAHNVKLPILPKDIWKLIIIEVCKLDTCPQPEKWYNNPLAWLWEWSKNTRLQKINPLNIISNNVLTDLQVNNLGIRYLILNTTRTKPLDQTGELISLKVRTTGTSGLILNVDRMGDLFYGILIPDNWLSKIKSIKYCFGNRMHKSSFDLNKPNEYMTYVLNENGYDYFTTLNKKEVLPNHGDSEYYTPKSIKVYSDPLFPVIPLISLAFDQVNVLIELHDKNLRDNFPNEIEGLYTYLEQESRHNIANHSYHLYTDNPLHECIFSHGRFKYKYDTEEIPEEITDEWDILTTYKITENTHKYKFENPDQKK